MPKLIKFFFIALLLVFSFFLSRTLVEASFGVSPADLTFESLSPGMEVEKDFLISRTNIDKEDEVKVETDVEGADSWFDVEPGFSFSIPKGKRTENMKVKIKVPKDIEYKTYKGFLTLKIAEGVKEAGVSVVGGVAVNVNLNVTQKESSELLVRGFDIPTVYKGKPIRLIMTVENKGNKKAAPDLVKILFQDLSRNELYGQEDKTLVDVEPGRRSEIIAEFENRLNPGEYYAKVFVDFEGKRIREDTIFFLVKEAIDQTQDSILSNSRSVIWVSFLKLTLLSLFPAALLWIIIRKRANVS